MGVVYVCVCGMCVLCVYVSVCFVCVYVCVCVYGCCVYVCVCVCVVFVKMNCEDRKCPKRKEGRKKERMRENIN